MPPPENTPTDPDRATQLGLQDHTGPDRAGGRVFLLNLRFVKFGTDNTTQAIAMILSFAILALLMLLLFAAPDSAQTSEVISALKNTLLITVGVAVGNGLPNKSD